MSRSDSLAAAAFPTTTPTFLASAFGLEVASPLQLPGLTYDPHHAPSRRTTMKLATTRELERSWDPAGATCLLDRRHRDGKLMMTIHAHPELGFRVFGPHHGRHVISADGRNVLSMLPVGPSWRWQRLLYAQVLPLCAILQGLELFHASAVEMEGAAFAFIASSGAGKSSIATHLVARGATLMTDDVLALEPVGDEILAHPGGGLVGIADKELNAVPAARRPRLGRVVGRSDKILLAPRRASSPSQLRCIYFLARNDRGGRLSVDDLESPDPLQLLSGIFISYVQAPRRLENHLDVCAQIAERARLAEVSVPPGRSAVEVTDAVLAHMETVT